MPSGIVGAVQVNVLHRPAHVVLRGRLVTQQLLDGGGNLAAVLLQLLPLIRVLGEHIHRVADQLGDRLRAGSAEEACERRDFEIVELVHLAVLALQLGLQPAC